MRQEVFLVAHILESDSETVGRIFRSSILRGSQQRYDDDVRFHCCRMHCCCCCCTLQEKAVPFDDDKDDDDAICAKEEATASTRRRRRELDCSLAHDDVTRPSICPFIYRPKALTSSVLSFLCFTTAAATTTTTSLSSHRTTIYLRPPRITRIRSLFFPPRGGLVARS